MNARRERFELARDTFAKALRRLHEALALDETPIHRDALIQRFEFTYELGWKAMFHWLQAEGEKVPEMARAVIQRAFQAELIADPELWESIKECRNATSHTYDEAKAVQVAAFVRERAAAAFDALAERLGTA